MSLRALLMSKDCSALNGAFIFYASPKLGDKVQAAEVVTDP